MLPVESEDLIRVSLGNVCDSLDLDVCTVDRTARLGGKDPIPWARDSPMPRSHVSHPRGEWATYPFSAPSCGMPKVAHASGGECYRDLDEAAARRTLTRVRDQLVGRGAVMGMTAIYFKSCVLFVLEKCYTCVRP